MFPRFLLLLLLCATVLSLGFGLMSGSLPLAPVEVLRALLGNGEDTAAEVLWQLRVPRVLAAFACGGLLALSGVLLQALLRNPLADPYILGISGGAAVGALAAMLLGASLAAMQMASFAGALLAIIAVFGLGFLQGERNIYRLLLTGVVLSAGCGAVVSLLLTLAQGEQVKGMLFWLMGDLSHPEGLLFAWFVLIALGLCATVFSGGLDVLAGGSDKAAALGLAVGRWQMALYFAAAALTVAALQLGGAIGFVGLMMPHAVRLLGIGAHRWLIPLSVLLGGSFLVLADTLARTLWSPLQLPVGVFTALLGVPVLLWLLGEALMLQAHKLTVAIGGKVVCRELDIVIRPGECWGVLGQNGAGKTTLLRALAGLHPPQAGAVSWSGQPLLTHARRDLARHLGVLLQNEGGEFWGSVLEYVLLGRFPHRASLFGYSAGDERIARQALEQMELAELAQRPLGTLSGGERQRAAIAQVLAQRGQCYLLDEPLQHLDLRHQVQAMRVFGKAREEGGALLMVLHDILWAQRCCDHVLLQFADGRVLQGAAGEMLTREHLEALYQCPLHELAAEGERSFVPGV